MTASFCERAVEILDVATVPTGGGTIVEELPALDAASVNATCDTTLVAHFVAA